MRYEEAITLLHTLRTKYVCTQNHCGLVKNGEPCVERNCDGYHDALAMAIEALEKQSRYDRLMELALSSTALRDFVCDKLYVSDNKWCKINCCSDVYVAKDCIERYIDWSDEE